MLAIRFNSRFHYFQISCKCGHRDITLRHLLCDSTLYVSGRSRILEYLSTVPSDTTDPVTNPRKAALLLWRGKHYEIIKFFKQTKTII